MTMLVWDLFDHKTTLHHPKKNPNKYLEHNLFTASRQKGAKLEFESLKMTPSYCIHD